MNPDTVRFVVAAIWAWTAIVLAVLALARLSLPMNAADRTLAAVFIALWIVVAVLVVYG